MAHSARLEDLGSSFHSFLDQHLCVLREVIAAEHDRIVQSSSSQPLNNGDSGTRNATRQMESLTSEGGCCRPAPKLLQGSATDAACFGAGRSQYADFRLDATSIETRPDGSTVSSFVMIDERSPGDPCALEELSGDEDSDSPPQRPMRSELKCLQKNEQGNGAGGNLDELSGSLMSESNTKISPPRKPRGGWVGDLNQAPSAANSTGDKLGTFPARRHSQSSTGSLLGPTPFPERRPSTMSVLSSFSRASRTPAPSSPASKVLSVTPSDPNGRASEVSSVGDARNSVRSLFGIHRPSITSSNGARPSARHNVTAKAADSLHEAPMVPTWSSGKPRGSAGLLVIGEDDDDQSDTGEKRRSNLQASMRSFGSALLENHVEDENLLQNFEVREKWAQVIPSISARSAMSTPKLMKQNTLRSQQALASLVNSFEEEEEAWYRIQVLSPVSVFRLLWDAAACILVTCDLLLIPATLAGLKPTSGVIDDCLQWIGRLFWSLDMILGFFTGFEKQDGSVERLLKKACLHHLKHDFLLDLLVVSITWAEMWSDEWVIQALALLRLLRLMKLKHMIQILVHHIDSEATVLFIKLLQSMLLICATIHVMACGWLGLGLRKNGWVIAAQLEGKSSEQYALSFHWALSQFYGAMELAPSNLQERNYACTSLLFAFFAVTAFVSDVTSSMTRLHILSGQQSLKLRVLRKFLISQGVSSSLSLRVQENAVHALKRQQTNIPEESVELLNLISEPLRIEIHFEKISPYLTGHPLLLAMLEEDEMMVKQLCHKAIKVITAAHGDVLFSRGELPMEPNMLFLMSGTMEYTLDAEEFETLNPGDWATEHVLWTHWTYHGLLAASGECTIACLDARALEQLPNSQLLQVSLPEYAQAFVQHVNGLGLLERSDLMDYDTVLGITQEAAPHVRSKNRRRSKNVFSW